jgi:energy-coupling factor transporter ATP-binding protein EcfA2
LCGLLNPTAGEIVLTDATGAALPGDRTRGSVTALFQQPERQFFLSTCAEEIAFGPTNLGRDLTRAEVDAMFNLVGLDVESFRGRDPITLSGGEKRRLASAAVLSMRPRFVLFDEPTCGLDQEGVGRFEQLCMHLKRQGVGLVIITHDGDIIYDLADRVLALSGDGSSRLRTKRQFFDNPQLAEVVSPLSGGRGLS